MKLAGLALGLLCGAAQAASVAIPYGNGKLKAEFQAANRYGAPAVIILHGCGGLLNKEGDLGLRYERIASQLQELDFAVLIPQAKAELSCQPQQLARQKAAMNARANELAAAISWLKKRPQIDAKRIAVVAWDQGATATLALLNRKSPGIRSAALFYPACKPLLGREYRVAAPTLLLAGEHDNLTPSAHCSELAQASGQSLFHVVTYPGVRHDFDLNPEQASREALNLPRNHLALDVLADPEAASDAWRRTFKWLSRWFDPERSIEGVPPRNLPVPH
ncbi:dienelactone hydrolase family protein [Chitinibacter tainanensis]|uniref:dienelactone hydrolase family protein n=1 Tax=Chitinibacter tainanensis TaxID=230667 RepID=UPI0023569E1F|nr:dienelactone hydrolase family protein [Chitinibacter tainanensis]